MSRLPFQATVLALLTALFLMTAAPAPAHETFPLRAYYPEVPVITTARLLKEYDRAVIVDIRSAFEYEVARINKAVPLPLTDRDFVPKIEGLRPKKSNTPLVFYCNGHSCAKSYKAAQLCLSLGFNNVFTYDGGIFDWIAAAPDRATLMGETPARRDRVIPAATLAAHQLDYPQFSAAAADPDTVVIDIRDPFQRALVPRIRGVRNIPLDPLLDLVTSRIWTEKRLLFFDAVGKQVRWLQYFLESNDYFDYAFLRGGMGAIAHDSALVVPVIEADRTVVSDQDMLLRLTADRRLDNTDRKVLSYLLANIKFNNYVVIDMDLVARDTGLTDALLLDSMSKLSRCGYVVHALRQDMLIVQVDPRLAWKGEQGSRLWQDKVQEFKDSKGK